MSKQILVRLFSILATGSLLAGATYAYFTSTATSANNAFAAGDFKIRIANPGATNQMPFNVTKMQPGSTATAFITVVNDGDFDMKWRAYISNGDGGALFPALRITEVILHPSDYDGYTTLEGNGYTLAGLSDLSVLPSTVSFNDLVSPNNGHLVWEKGGATVDSFAPNWAATYKITVQMDPAADNSYIGTSWKGDLTFYATQDTTDNTDQWE